MTRTLLAGLLTHVLLLGTLAAQPPVPKEKPPEPAAGGAALAAPEQPQAPTPYQVKPLTLSPAKAIKPASRAYLLPEYGESLPGNSVQMFLRCFMEQTVFYGREEEEKRQKLLELPLGHPDLKGAYEYGGRLVGRDMADAARMRRADWQIDEALRRDGIGTLLPDAQVMRRHAQVLAVRLRGDVAAGKPMDAIHDLRTLFGLARTFDAHPTLIGHLIGIAIASIAFNALDELVQLPDCPSLYWALIDMPNPVVDIRLGIQGERIFVSNMADPLVKSADPLSDAQLGRILAEMDKFEGVGRSNDALERFGSMFGKARVRFTLLAADDERVAADRKFLVEAGIDAPRVAAMSPLQVVAAGDYVYYQEQADEAFKLYRLPAYLSLPALQAISRARLDGRGVIFPLFLGATDRIRAATARLETQHALLTAVEALRLHAADHNGQLPASLDQVKLYVPNDPYTGKPFAYTFDGTKATLKTSRPVAPFNDKIKVYELTMRK